MSISPASGPTGTQTPRGNRKQFVFACANRGFTGEIDLRQQRDAATRRGRAGIDLSHEIRTVDQ
jgi:hypothetical protein